MENIAFNIALEEIDDHFTEKLNDNLNKIREQLQYSHENTSKPWIQNIHRSSDSPVTMSSNSGSDSDDITVKTTDIHTEKLNVLDTLNIYFRCQKYMYDQSSKNTLFKHNCVSGITISITSGICIFISFIEMYQWRTVIIIVLNVIVSILLLLSKYWKLEITAELYSYISRQFELISKLSINLEKRKVVN